MCVVSHVYVCVCMYCMYVWLVFHLILFQFLFYWFVCVLHENRKSWKISILETTRTLKTLKFTVHKRQSIHTYFRVRSVKRQRQKYTRQTSTAAYSLHLNLCVQCERIDDDKTTTPTKSKETVIMRVRSKRNEIKAMILWHVVSYARYTVIVHIRLYVYIICV